MKEKGSSFSGSIGFVLAAAGSAVGVGNIWRFPYLCAKDGGGLFLLVYLVLVLTFGFVLLTTDVAIGRKTKKNALRAFEALNPKWKFLGKLTFLVPTLIMTYLSSAAGSRNILLPILSPMEKMPQLTDILHLLSPQISHRSYLCWSFLL